MAWTWITTAVCLVWDVVTTIVNAIIVTIESIIGWILDAIAFLIELILKIPIIGRFIRWVWDLVVSLGSIFASLPDIILGAFGIRPEKKLRICPIILNDESGSPVVSDAYAIQVLQDAVDIFRREANIRIIPMQPFQYDSGLAADEVVTEDWLNHATGNGDSEILDVPCNEDGFLADLWVTGTRLDWISSTTCFFGSFRRLVGYGAPVTAFFIRSIPSGTDPTCGSFGCGLWLTDYITIRNQPCATSPNVNRRVGAHELGHACNLWHIGAGNNPTNLMGTPWNSALPALTQTQLYDWQILLSRASKHVTYF